MARAEQRAQIGLEEELLESDELATLLDNRESAKEALKPYRKRFKDADILAKAKIGTLELSDGAYRCGEFIVKISEAEEKRIEFDRASSKRLTITPRKS